MTRNLLTGCGIAICGSCACARAASNFAFTGSIDRSGDRSGALQMANDFTVNSPTGINVSQLGLFIDGYDGSFVTGPGETHKVTLFNRSNGATIASVNISAVDINTIDGPFSYTNPGISLSLSAQSEGAWGYVNITPVLLPNGFQGSIVAYTMSDAGAFIDDYGEFAGFNSGGGLISFTHSYYAATTGTSGDPATNSTTEAYAAGSFTFSAVQAPEPAGLTLLGIGALALVRRRRHA
jgi:MYXO-CTERM domain-containing protein